MDGRSLSRVDVWCTLELCEYFRAEPVTNVIERSYEPIHACRYRQSHGTECENGRLEIKSQLLSEAGLKPITFPFLAHKLQCTIENLYLLVQRLWVNTCFQVSHTGYISPWFSEEEEPVPFVWSECARIPDLDVHNSHVYTYTFEERLSSFDKTLTCTDARINKYAHIYKRKYLYLFLGWNMYISVFPTVLYASPIPHHKHLSSAYCTMGVIIFGYTKAFNWVEDNTSTHVYKMAFKWSPELNKYFATYNEKYGAETYIRGYINTHTHTHIHNYVQAHTHLLVYICVKRSMYIFFKNKRYTIHQLIRSFLQVISLLQYIPPWWWPKTGQKVQGK